MSPLNSPQYRTIDSFAGVTAALIALGNGAKQFRPNRLIVAAEDAEVANFFQLKLRWGDDITLLWRIAVKVMQLVDITLCEHFIIAKAVDGDRCLHRGIVLV